MASLRRVLMVAFHFPPQKGSSAAQRTLRFAQYLPRHGWSAAVVSAAPRAYQERSDDQLADIPADVPVVRPWAWDASRHFAFRGKYWLATALPDRWSTWVPFALLAGWWQVRRLRPRALFSTYPLASAHLIGAGLQRLTGLPWVADIRDPMTGMGSAARGVRHRLYRWIETLVARRAAAVVFATAEAREEFQHNFPEVPAARLRVIENGYDEGDFLAAANAKVARDSRALVLVHSGLLSPDTRSPIPFFEALAKLLPDGHFNGQPVQVVFRASHSETVHRPVAERLGLSAVVRWEGGLPYRAALAEMLAADGLLIFQGHQHDSQIPAKIYEYCRAGRPVMGLIGVGGKTARFMADEGLLHLAPLLEVDAIVPVLRQFLTQLQDGTAPVVPLARAQQFSREFRTAELAAVLDAVTGGSADAEA
jgi:glycosyltransferase involved in cell wall biosynthesis